MGFVLSGGWNFFASFFASQVMNYGFERQGIAEEQERLKKVKSKYGVKKQTVSDIPGLKINFAVKCVCVYYKDPHFDIFTLRNPVKVFILFTTTNKHPIMH